MRRTKQTILFIVGRAFLSNFSPLNKCDFLFVSKYLHRLTCTLVNHVNNHMFQIHLLGHNMSSDLQLFWVIFVCMKMKNSSVVELSMQHTFLSYCYINKIICFSINEKKSSTALFAPNARNTNKIKLIWFGDELV